MAPSDAESLKARLESVGRARLTDVEAAQQRIVGVIRRMEEEGKIVVGRAGEMTS
jgi:flagellar motor switch protein FliG